jgi:hypothetical protein
MLNLPLEVDMTNVFRLMAALMLFAVFLPLGGGETHEFDTTHRNWILFWHRDPCLLS